jgi:hypothetical protein
MPCYFPTSFIIVISSVFDGSDPSLVNPYRTAVFNCANSSGMTLLEISWLKYFLPSRKILKSMFLWLRIRITLMRSGSIFSLQCGSGSCSSSATTGRYTDPPGLHFEPPRLHCEPPRPSTAPFLAIKAS